MFGLMKLVSLKITVMFRTEEIASALTETGRQKKNAEGRRGLLLRSLQRIGGEPE
jgi:hypothetical protein